MALVIENPGILTSVQDGGRRGFMAAGFSPCGALDSRSMTIANLLCGNAVDEAVLEMTLTGIDGRFTSPAVIALAGGDFSPTLNGAPLPMYAACAVKAGDRLSCGFAKTGCRAYLAVSGGFALAPVMGSRSTYLKYGLGGFLGRKLAAGDTLGFRANRETLPNLAGRVWKTVPQLDTTAGIAIRAIPGPQDTLFAGRGLEQFFSQPFTVSNQSDRMGIRLEGEPIVCDTRVDIISDGIALGSVQVPASGQPIVLLADRQTTGGYAKIATVITTDIPHLAQCRPGDTVRFNRITVAEAQKHYIREQREYHRWYKKWSRGSFLR
jgi:biotin-dependent carboxylase-like uncharacterized protein